MWKKQRSGWEPRIGRTLILPEIEVMPWLPGHTRKYEETWSLFQKFLITKLGPMHYQIDGVLTIVMRSTELMGFAWSVVPLRSKVPRRREDLNPPAWFPV